ncbi:MAG: nucleotide pyrophosphohydrolase [Erysipelotrichaceae bacterium]
MKYVLEELLRFRDAREWEVFHTPENLAKSISIEAAELLECFQWSADYELEAVKEELADVLAYALLLANRLDLDVETIVLEKMRKNEVKYPVEESRGNSKKYTQLEQYRKNKGE